VVLGITTLLYMVPTPVAATHQAGSLALLTGVIVLGSRVWTPSRLAKLVKGKTDLVKRLQVKRAAKRTREANVKMKIKVAATNKAQRLF